MKLVASATIKKRIAVSATLVARLLASATIRSNQPTASLCDEYDLISGGNASTLFVPINGFNLISGGGA